MGRGLVASLSAEAHRLSLSDETPQSGPDRPERDEDESPIVDPEIVAETGDEPEPVRLRGEVIQAAVSFRQAPYPTPEDLRQYEDIHPGFTDRILALTERETEHRIERETFQDRSTFELARRGQTCAFIIVMTLVFGGIAAILTGHSIAGFAGLVLAAATLAGAFFGPKVLSGGSRPPELEPGSDIAEPSSSDAEPPAEG